MFPLARLVIFTAISPVLTSVRMDPRLFMTGVELARDDGYESEVLPVTTEDGYILNVFRILPVGSEACKGAVVILHGLAGSADNFILLGKGRALAYVLAEEGYDVYLANFRGNMYSRRHVKLKHDDKEFWNFTFAEMAMYDVPAVLKLARETSGQPRVFVVAYSMGGTTFYTMLATRLQEQRHIRAAFMLGPCVYAFHMYSPFGKFLFNMPDSYTKMLSERRPYVVAERASGVVAELVNDVCAFGSPYHDLCFAIFKYLTNCQHIYRDKLIFYFIHMFGGTSIRSFIHFIQIYRTKRFAAFDHGVQKNLVRYGSRRPPEYKFVNITVPIALHYSESDRETPAQDVLLLQNVSSNSIGTIKVPLKNYSHFDFILSDYSKELLYDKIIAIMKLY